MHYFIDALKKYAEFDGRASRADFWYYYLFYIIFYLVAMAIDYFIAEVVGTISFSFSAGYEMAIIIPSLAIEIRRMHDVNKSGWFILVPFYNLVLLCTNGTKGDNQYGPEPVKK